MVKTDYAAHDRRYRARRANGDPGWDSDDGYREREVLLAWVIDALARAGATGRRMLELGCGAGNLAAWFADRGYDVTGIDISPTAIAWATDRAIPRARFVVGDVTARLPFAGELDVVLDGHCLHCIIGDDRARVLAGVRDALVPGGHFVIATMTGAVTNPKLLAVFEPVSRCQVVDGIAYRYIGDAAEILDEVRAAGFEIVCSMISGRKHVDDQDDLWALARRPQAVQSSGVP